MTWLINTTIHLIEPLKMKSINVKSSICIDFNKKNSKEGHKFKVDDNVGT